MLSRFIFRVLVPVFVCQISCQYLMASAPVLINRIQNVSIEVEDEDLLIDLKEHFYVNPIVEYKTVGGSFKVELLGLDAPITVANFLNITDEGSYDNTIFHRSVTDSSNGFDFSIIQGGGFKATIPIESSPDVSTIFNEFWNSNIRGTIAMAKTSVGPDSATNQWFFNLADNSWNLDFQNGGFTVFGRVIDESLVAYENASWAEGEVGLTVVDGLSTIPKYNLGGGFESVPLLNLDTNNDLALEHLVTVDSITRIDGFSSSPSSEYELSISVSSSNSALVVASEIDGVLQMELVGSGTGESDVEVIVADQFGNVARDTFRVTVITGALSIVNNPVGRAARVGEDVNLIVRASSDLEVSYQWEKDGVAIEGANEATLVLDDLTEDDGGTYHVVVSNGTLSAPSKEATVEVVSDYARMVNISTRAFVGLGDQSLIAGAVVVGNEGDKKNILLRAVGPGMNREFGFEGVIEDPLLLFTDDPLLVEFETNDNWGDDPNVSENRLIMPRVGAFALEEGSKDAVLSREIDATSFTGVFTGVDDSTGLGLVECYDADEDPLVTNARIVNLSTRAEVRLGEQIAIAGFVVDGDTAINVLIRGVGEGLKQVSDLPDELLLLDPRIDLYSMDSESGPVLITSNDDWELGPSYQSVRAIGASVGAFDLLSGSADAVMLVTLQPGSYSVLLSGANSGTGIGLVEVYEVRNEWSLPYEIADLDVSPRLLSKDSPEFPEELFEQGIDRGWVLLEWVIRTDGTVELVTIISSSHPEFEESTVESYSNSLWEPGKVGGLTVRTRVQQRINLRH